MKIIFACGGTGGHINPAIALADEFKRRYPFCEILFVGRIDGMEGKLVPKAGYKMESIDVCGIKRCFSPSNFKAVSKVVFASAKCKRLMDSFRPDAVIGTGGYVCYPVLSAAASKNIFTAVHESNAIPGMAVKLLKKRMHRIYVNFSECTEALGNDEKILRTGNPERLKLDPENRDELRRELGVSGRFRYVLLSFGGSLGAATINREILKLMQGFTSKHPEILHVHAAGSTGISEFKTEMALYGLDKCKNLKVSEYIFDMPKWMISADAVICRAGAMTLSELAGAGRASVLIPSPNVVDNHQYKNAKAFENGGAAFVVRESESELSHIREYVETLLFDKEVRRLMENNARNFYFGDASGVIVNDIVSSIKRE